MTRELRYNIGGLGSASKFKLKRNSGIRTHVQSKHLIRRSLPHAVLEPDIPISNNPCQHRFQLCAGEKPPWTRMSPVTEVQRVPFRRCELIP